MSSIGGFSFANYGGYTSFQIGTKDLYGISIVPYAISTDERFEYSGMSVVIFKEESDVNEDGDYPNKIFDIMKLMNYTPSEEETQRGMFLNVSPSMLAKILTTVTNL